MIMTDNVCIIDELEFIKENSEYSVRAKDTKIKGEIIIPEKVNGLPVTKIEEDGFCDCCLITKVVIPDSIKNIGKYAFDGCINLKKIKIKGKLDNLGEFAFFNTDYYNNSSNWDNGLLFLENILLSSSMLDKVTKSVSLKKGTYMIAPQAFSDKSIVSLTLPKSLEIICFGAFARADINKLTFASAPTIKERAFEYAHISFLNLKAQNIEKEAFYNAKVFEFSLEEILNSPELSAFKNMEISRFLAESIPLYENIFRESIFSSTTAIIDEKGIPIKQLQAKNINFPIYENLSINTLIIDGKFYNNAFKNSSINSLVVVSEETYFQGPEVFENAKIGEEYILGKLYNFPEITNDVLNEAIIMEHKSSV